jgi:hypothetical protein
MLHKSSTFEDQTDDEIDWEGIRFVEDERRPIGALRYAKQSDRSVRDSWFRRVGAGASQRISGEDQVEEVRRLPRHDGAGARA